MKKEAFVIRGLAGEKKLSGSIKVNGAKNAALQALAFSLLFGDEVKFENVPEISDTDNMIKLLEEVGSVVKKMGKGKYSILSPKKANTSLLSEISKKFRASIVLTGPLLARYGRVSFPHPGGCVIGSRPIDVFLDGFDALGAKTKVDEDGYEIISGDKLKGNKIFLKVPSVTGAQTLLMASVLAKGKTVIKNAPLEPETEDFVNFLNRCGAKIKGVGGPQWEIVGGKLLKANGKSYKIPPDRIETGSFLIMGALLAKRFEIKNCEPLHIESLIETLKGCGVSIDVGKDSIIVEKTDKVFSSTNIKTREYPGFPTDLQAPMVVFLTQARGEALVFETIFEGRLNYVNELIRMGANISLWDPHRVTVRGATALRGREVESPDIRAGLAFIIAAALAEGESVIHNIHYIDRGYEKIEDRLRGVGLDIKRILID